VSAPKNLPASVKARLLNLAESRGESFNELLGRYAVERLLYRLGQSQHADRFLLKGAMLFVLWDGRIPRPTRDVDFLGFGQIEVETVVAAFREIAAIPVPPDGLEFMADTVTAEEIREGQGYGGVRVKLVARLGTGRIPLQVDIGSGDAVTPSPEESDFPVLLDFPAPRVRAYPVYTVVAEKFEAIVSLGVRNTRMKDFHDLWFLSRRFDFDGDTLHRAIEATFTRRKTDLAGELLPFTADYIHDADRQTQWRAFLARNGLQGPPEQFPVLMTALRDFVVPAIHPNDRRWRADSGTWTPQ
jgi:predicted nucleotidyltransferase component of viral defense system